MASTNNIELITLELEKRLRDFKKEWEDFSKKTKKKVEELSSQKPTGDETAVLDEIAKLMINQLNAQIAVAKRGEDLLTWVQANGLEDQLTPEDLKNLEGCVGVGSLPEVKTLEDYDNFEVHLKEVKKTNDNYKKKRAIEKIKEEESFTL